MRLRAPGAPPGYGDVVSECRLAAMRLFAAARLAPAGVAVIVPTPEPWPLFVFAPILELLLLTLTMLKLSSPSAILRS